MKAKLHLLPRTELRDQFVSSTSLWYDAVWQFENETAGQWALNSAISWDIELPDNSNLLDERWADLLDAFRRLVWSLFTSPRNGKRYKPGMAEDFGRQIKYFARWMAAYNYTSFGELDSIAFDEYVEFVYEDKGSDTDAEPTAINLMKYLRVPTLIWIQAPELEAAGVAPPLQRPYGGSSAFSVAKRLAEDKRGQIAPIADDIAIAILNTALQVVDDIDAIFGAIDFFITTSEKVREVKRPQRTYFMTDFRQVVAERWPAALPYLQANSIWPVWRAIATVRAAASIWILGGVGVRPTELCGLDGRRKNDGTPACIAIRKSISGLDEIFFIRGRVYKGEHGWVEHEWVAGTRPVGSDHLPPPVKAVYGLEKLLRRFRNAHNNNRLSLYSEQRSGLINNEHNFIPAKTSMLARSHKLFLAKNVHLKDVDVNPSQWRKTFAQFIVRTDSKMPPALRDHFRHASLAITEVGYATADPDYKQVIDDAAVQDAIEFVGSLISERQVSGGTMVEAVRASGARLRQRMGNRSDEERDSDIEELVLETGLRVHELRFGHTPAGNCLFRPGTGRCTQGCIAKWIMPAPLWSAARPDVCWDCENIVVSLEHGDYWQSRWERHSGIHKSAVESGDVALASLARSRMSQCAVLLAGLGISVNQGAED